MREVYAYVIVKRLLHIRTYLSRLMHLEVSHASSEHVLLRDFFILLFYVVVLVVCILSTKRSSNSDWLVHIFISELHKHCASNVRIAEAAISIARAAPQWCYLLTYW